MIKLLIISDDFTGALDTSVQLSVSGATAYVTLDFDFNTSDFSPETDVLVVDAETRHLNRKDAYEAVFSITEHARKAGIPYIYKKTDSVLRGNIGAELSAVLKASGQRRIHFIPAYPQMDRTTRKGIHYADNIPIDKSIFGKDPFEPVLYSDITQIIRSQTDVTTSIIEDPVQDWSQYEGILIHDSQSVDDLELIAQKLKEKGEIHLLAGCAGFAALLPALTGLWGNKPQIPEISSHLLIACGSIHPVSLAQCSYAARRGAPHYHLTPEEKLNPFWTNGEEACSLVSQVFQSCEKSPVVILNANGPDEPGKTYAYAKEKGIDLLQIRENVVTVMAQLIEGLIDRGVNATVFLMGGDLLYQFVKQTGINVISPVCEVEHGVVLSEVLYKGERVNILSKSGGFGRETLFMDLSDGFQRNLCIRQ
ncbi:four-carbon acid sugar kinase family protein [Lacrimispora defluvii]|uniref:Four-carbon acid sugar kinase family protein n=1 Tax=Lacrimispora defluvii TaxID=2719233 RepID=A0ABX1VLH7_9FIRM|nr:four-carbon acid sugar kinase family protein [Lacrimispora defluvii]NNJ28854.1 four-carbon acid sugar kinase family protein [Lacrimispora defluvii]